MARRRLQRGRQVIIVPAEQPHKFVNSGDDRLKQVGIHLNKQTITHWLED